MSDEKKPVNEVPVLPADASAALGPLFFNAN